MPIVPVEEIAALVGHRFPGGTRRIAHWENFLLGDAISAQTLPDDLAHPVHLFHIPIDGARTSIRELFGLGRADTEASVSIDYYDWEYLRPLREEHDYDVQGGIIEHERKSPEDGPVVDSLTFRIELIDTDETTAARATIRWHFWRFAR